MRGKYKKGLEKEPMATEGCILTNYEEMDGQRAAMCRILFCPPSAGWNASQLSAAPLSFLSTGIRMVLDTLNVFALSC
ncbi:hypothetical protein EYF80_000463 [Liparis tanakae]|uniref:Uncharacterized protein n=1 Tax=Liparis tanakae TaxID=230148 RepID=A0A4Z2JG04_9TELE|nr:hypothetical protein EYF80_000463 [Liparis tanakae]